MVAVAQLGVTAIGQTGPNPYGAPTPQVPEGVDSFGNAFEGPGPFPGRLTGANVRITVEPGSVLGGAGSNNLLVEFPSMGPISWTDARHNEGDIAFNLSPSQAGALPPDEFGEWAVSDGPTTYAWSVDRRAGIAMATVRANGFDNGDSFSDGGSVGTQYGAAYFTHGFRSGVAYSPIDGVYSNGNFSQDMVMGMVGPVDEANFDVSLAYFPFVEGWTGGQVAASEPLPQNVDEFDGEAIVNFEAGSIGFGVNPRQVIWLDYNDNVEFDEGVAAISIPGVEDAEEDGMLFVQPANGSSNTKLAGATPEDARWVVALRDDRETDDEVFLARGDAQFSFLYLPWNTEGLIGAYVAGDSGDLNQSMGAIAVSRDGEGAYTVTVEGKGADDGMLILSNAGSMEADAFVTDVVPTAAFLSYEANDDGSFAVESHVFTTGAGENVDTDFYVAWVDFSEPMKPAPTAAPRLLANLPAGVDLLIDLEDPLTELDDQEVDIAVNTDRPEILVTTIVNVSPDQGDRLGLIEDPITGDDAVEAVVAYYIDPFTGAIQNDPDFPDQPFLFTVMGNPAGNLETLDVEYNPVSKEYVVITKGNDNQEAQGFTFGQPLMARVNSFDKVLAGEDALVDARQIDDFVAGYDDVSLAISTANGNILVVAEQSVPDEGEGIISFLLDTELNPLTPNARLDTLESTRDEDDPDVIYSTAHDVFIALTNIDPSTESNRITLMVVETEPDSDGALVFGTQQIVGTARKTGVNQGHAALVDNPFNDQFILAFDYGNGNDGGDLVYLELNESGSFVSTAAQVPYLEATGGDPFNHRHPQMAADPNSDVLVLAHNLRSNDEDENGVAFTLLGTDGQILPVDSDAALGFHAFLPSNGQISNGANYVNVVYDEFTDSFVYAYNDPFDGTRVGRIKALTPPPAPAPSIVDILEDPNFSTLRSAIIAADLVDILASAEGVTILAPTNAAFDALPEGTLDSLLLPENLAQLQNIILSHVVGVEAPASVVVTLSEVETLSGALFPVAFDGTTVMVGAATVVDTDIAVTQGLVHVIDQVLVPEASGFKLQVLHSSDNESSFQDPNTLEPKILNYATVVEGLRAFAATEGYSSLHLTAGDYTLPGPFYQAAAEAPSFGAPGLADIAFFNAMGVDANGMGNHEFDGGINEFATMLNTANYPFLAVNLDFANVVLADGTPAIEIGEDAVNVTELAGKVARSAWIEVDGELIGLIGRAPADFFNIIENPAENLPGLDFVGGRDPETNQPLVSAVGLVQEQVELLESKGVNKIILLDHAQDFTADPLSASLLRGVDIIVAAGSTGFMASSEVVGPFNLLREGDEPETDYPTVRADSEGNNVLVVDSDHLFSYVGQLLVEFDADGHIVMVDDRSGPVATSQASIDALGAVVSTTLTVPTEVQSIYDEIQATDLVSGLFTQIGTTTEELVGLRAEVRTRETNLGRLAADSTLWGARRFFAVQGIERPVDLALKNGGGIRATILGPAITRLQVNTALSFNNTLAIIDLTVPELVATMENAVSRVPATDGRFPHMAGAFIEFDPTMDPIEAQVEVTEPSRIATLIVTREDGTQEVVVENFAIVGDDSRTFTIAINSFALTGGDGYAAFPAAGERGSVETTIGERQILADYIVDVLGGAVDVPEPVAPRVVFLDSAGVENVRIAVTGSGLVVSYEIPDTFAATIRYEATSDLNASDWTPLVQDQDFTTSVEDIGSALQRITLELPTPDAAALFIRIIEE